MGRKASRKHAFIIIYQSKFHKDFDAHEAAELYLESLSSPVAEPDKTFMRSLIDGTLQNLSVIDELIKSRAQGWDLERINSIDLAIMRLAVYEIKYAGDAPISVAINEAVELAKVYGVDESATFINGILGKIAST